MPFSEFLIGTVLVSSLVLLVLLVAPRPLQDVHAPRLSWVGISLAVLLMVLGFISGLSVAS